MADQKTEYHINLLSLNVRGIREKNKRTSIFHYIQNKQVDLCLLQETHATSDDENEWVNEWKGKIYFSNGTSRARGTMILIRPGFDLVVHNVEKDSLGRFLYMNVSTQNSNLHIINIYAPNIEHLQIKFYQDLYAKLSHLLQRDSEKNIIIGGDFNIIFNPQMDRKGGNFQYSRLYTEIINKLDDLINDLNLCDIWRRMNPDLKRYTWRQRNPQIHSRLDIWLISEHMIDFVKETSIKPSIRSDHSAIYIEIDSFNTQRGKGYWKFNNSFLDEEPFVNEITDNFQRWQNECQIFSDERAKWEYIKYKVRLLSIQYGKIKNKRLKDDESHLEAKLTQIDHQIESQINTEDETRILLRERSETESKLKDIDDYKTEGILLRAKCLWYEKGEKNNKYFLNLISRNKQRTVMNKLINDNGETIYNQTEILNCQAEYYKNLYSEKQQKNRKDIKEYVKNVNVKCLSIDEKLKCESTLTEAECQCVLNSFKKSKTPGTDGLTVEFYKKFWNLLKSPLVNSLNRSYIEGQLSYSQRQAVITLIDKKKDRTLLKNWRPISLLNVDYKIASKTIAERFKQFLPKLINNSQVGYVQGRYITENIRTAIDIMHFAKQKHLPGIFVNIDFQKAFDSINWVFLEEVLIKFNFGASFIRWIKTFYNNITSCIINNGNLSKEFILERGVRQGDPLSPYLFILVVEVLGQIIRDDNDIKGFVFNKHEIKLLQYADDTTGCLSDLNSARRFLYVVNQFGSFSGLKLNREKTEGMWLGKDRMNTSTPLGISWSNTPFRMLGIFLSYDTVSFERFNFSDKINKCKHILNDWNRRRLTLFGRTQIVKTFIISQFLYVSSALYFPETYVKKINDMIFEFIWSGRKPKLKRDVLHLPKCQGGLNVPNFQNMLKIAQIKWIKLFIETDIRPWKTIFEYLFSDCNINLKVLLHSNYDVNMLPQIHKIPKFYLDLLKTWSICGVNESEKSQYIWYNKNLTVDKKLYFSLDFCNAGIKLISDLFMNCGKPKPFNSLIRQGVSRNKWLEWYRLVACIKKYIGSLSDSSWLFQKKEHDDNLSFCKHLSVKHIGELISNNIGGNNVHIPRVNKYFNNITDWTVYYNYIYKFIKNTDLMDFQFRFIHDILVNNYWLNIWKIIETKICNLCEKDEENLEHFFWCCTANELFLSSLRQFCRDKLNIEINKTNFLLGYDDMLFYYVCCFARQFIYQCRKNLLVPKWDKFLISLQSVKQVEFEIAKRNGSMVKWLEKWEPLL